MRDVSRKTDEWPPPGQWRDPATGRTKRATKRELWEAERLLAKHRDIAEGYAQPAPLPAETLAFLDGLGANIPDSLRGDQEDA
jgi:hypothetical protein